jgi:hypothetical protein
VGVVHQPVEDGVGEGGIAQGVMPMGERQLARDHGGAGLVAFVQDLQQIAATGIIEDGQAQSSRVRISTLPSWAMNLG